MSIVKLIRGDCLEVMKDIPDGSIDLVVTSPPYDNLRAYNGYTFDFEGVAEQIFRVVTQGGVVVWVIGDATVKGSETGTSFRQALHFKDLGFNLHDTMIWNKGAFSAVGALQNRYAPVFEYMFILSRGFPKTFNPLKDRKNKHAGTVTYGTIRNVAGTTKPMSKVITIGEYGQRFNIWEQPAHRQRGGHPAPFPEQLAHDHILSWSNEGDTVLDPMMGSGTTGKMAKMLNRNFVGIEISEQYLQMAQKRIEGVNDLFSGEEHSE